MKTFVAKPATIEKKWYVVDAAGQTLGRLSTVVADALRGKRKVIYTPNIDTGDFVVVVNAEKIVVTGNKLDEKIYWRHSGYPGGIKASRSGTCSHAGPKRSCAAPSRACCRTTGSGRAAVRSSRSTPAQASARRSASRNARDQGVGRVATVTYSGTGRRKTSVARVLLMPGVGPRWSSTAGPRRVLRSPRAADHRRHALRGDATTGKFDVRVNVNGGGMAGQAGAIRHGIARALVVVDRELRTPLKRAGFLTRDARAVERKKAGLKKARRRPQFSKR